MNSKELGKAGRPVSWLVPHRICSKELGRGGRLVSWLPTHLSSTKELGKGGRLVSWLPLHLSSTKELGKGGRLVSWLSSHRRIPKELGRVGRLVSWFQLQFNSVSETKNCRPSRSVMDEEPTYIIVSAITSGCVSSSTFPFIAFGTINCNWVTNAVSGMVYCACN